MSAYRVILRMQVIDGLESGFEAAWRDGADVIGREPANLGQWLSRSDSEPGVYYIVSDWVDEPSFRAYETSERHRLHRAALHPYRSGGSMSTTHLLATVPGAAVTGGAVR